MENDSLKKRIKTVCILWAVLAIGLFGGVMTGLLDKDLFMKIFSTGFVIFAVLVTVMSRELYTNDD